MNEQWQELKETITELRDNDGTCTQQEVCKFLVDYMELLENQMTEDAISRQGVIDAMIKRFDGENAHDQFWNCDMVMDILRDMPSVKPQEKTDVLDKIRAEIKEHVGINQNLNIERAKALCWCLDVIDKYAGAKEETCDLYDECNKECPLYMFCHQQESEEQA